MTNNRIYYGTDIKELHWIMKDEIYREIYINKTEVVVLGKKHRHINQKLDMHTTCCHEYPLMDKDEYNISEKYLEDIESLIMFYKKTKRNVKVYLFDLDEFDNLDELSKEYLTVMIRKLLEENIEIVSATKDLKDQNFLIKIFKNSSKDYNFLSYERLKSKN